MKRLPLFARLVLRELKRLGRTPLYLFCMVVAPLACCWFFSSLMSQGLPSELPVGLVDQDATALSRSLARHLDAFQSTAIVQRYPDVASARRAVQRGDIYGFFYIPKGTSRQAQRQEQPTVSFYMNYSYLIAGSLVYRDMRTMAEMASGSAAGTVLSARGASGEQVTALLQPIVVDTHPVGNPWLNYSVYLTNIIVPGLLLLFTMQITVFSLGAEVKGRTARRWLSLARGSMARALASKLLPHTLLLFVTGSAMLVYFYQVLAFPCHCGLGTMLLVMLLSIIAAQGLGVLMYAMLPTLRLGLSFASLWGILSFSLCGMSFPVMAMHPALQGLSLLFPLRHYYLLYVNGALNGYPLLGAWPYVAALLAFALLPVLVARRLRRALLTIDYQP